jgi:REP element-mobilizing transposase RayT
MPLISEHIETELYAAIAKKCRQLECEPIAIGGTDDHIHLLVSLHTNISVSQLVKDVKGSSSHLINHKIRPNESFKWQGGYGVFSVSNEALPKICTYIKNQKEHHRENKLENDWEI